MQYSPSKKCFRCGATNPVSDAANPVSSKFCLNCGSALTEIAPTNYAPPLGVVVGKVIELNKQGFRLKTGHGNECQVNANYEWKGIVKVGDEVNVKGGINENGIFLMAWMSVFRSGQWLDIEDLRKSRNWLKPWTWLKSRRF